MSNDKIDKFISSTLFRKTAFVQMRVYFLKEELFVKLHARSFRLGIFLLLYSPFVLSDL